MLTLKLGPDSKLEGYTDVKFTHLQLRIAISVQYNYKAAESLRCCSEM